MSEKPKKQVKLDEEEQKSSHSVSTSDGSKGVHSLSKPKGRVFVNISVDWEGTSLRPTSLEYFAKARQLDFMQDVPLTHFVCPGYFTWCEADLKIGTITKLLPKVILDRDEVGLHVHPMLSLLRAAGIDTDNNAIPNSAPSLLGKGFDYERKICPQKPVDPLKPDSEYRIEAGSYLHLSYFPLKVLESLIPYCKQRIEKEFLPLVNKHGSLSGFRAGAWLCSADVLDAVAKAGFLYDSSAVAAHLIAEFPSIDPAFNTDFSALLNRKEYWNGITTESMPYKVKTASGRTIMEIPDNGCLADYPKLKTMLAIVDAAFHRASKGQDAYLHFGFHQETVLEKWHVTEPVNLDKILNVVKYIKKSSTNAILVKFLTVSDACAL